MTTKTTTTRTIDDILADIAALQAELDQASTAIGDHVVIRSAQSGAWMGKLTNKVGDEVTLADARRLWYWDGAASLSQLALDGVSKPNTCKFPGAVPTVTVLGVCEIIPATAKAVASVQAVKPWKA